MSAITDKWLKAVPLYTDTLAGAISNATVTTFQVTNGSTDLENGEVYEVTIDRVTAQGVSTGRREVVIAQYTSATKTFDCSSADYRGIEGTAQAHPVGAVVEILVTAHYLNEHRAAFLVGHTQAGTHKSALVTTLKATSAEVATGTDDTKIVTPLAAAPYGYSSMARQAIINGNFDVWQRGTSFTIASATQTFTADRWWAYKTNTGMTVSQVAPGVTGSAWGLKMQRANGNSDTNSPNLRTNLESKDVIKLANRTITVSFRAKAGANFSAASSLLSYEINTGTGSDEASIGAYSGAWTGWAKPSSGTKTLTTSFQLFSFNLTLNANVRELAVSFYFTPTGTAGADDSVTIEQVQLCAGDVALPFHPKSFEEELRACMRYYEKSYEYTVAPGTATYTGETTVRGLNASSGQKYASTSYKVTKRTAATPSYWDPSGNASKVSTRDIAGAETANVSPTGIISAGTNGFGIYINSSTVCGLEYQWAVDTEL